MTIADTVSHYQQIRFNCDKSCFFICIISWPATLYSLNPCEDFKEQWLQCNGLVYMGGTLGILMRFMCHANCPVRYSHIIGHAPR